MEKIVKEAEPIIDSSVDYYVVWQKLYDETGLFPDAYFSMNGDVYRTNYIDETDNGMLVQCVDMSHHICSFFTVEELIKNKNNIYIF